MARLERKNFKVFGENAPLDEIGQFGSAKATTKKNTKDIEEIQELDAWSDGWGGAVISNKNYPPMEEMTGAMNVMSYQTAYTLQEGIPEWNKDTTYYKGSIVKNLEGEDVNLYQSIINNNVNKALSDTTAWKVITNVNTELSNLNDVGADKLNISKMYTTDSVSEDKQGLEQLKQMKHSTFDLSKFTVVGSPTITDDGVVNSDSNNYISFIPAELWINASNWHLQFYIYADYDNASTSWFMKFVNDSYGFFSIRADWANAMAFVAYDRDNREILTTIESSNRYFSTGLIKIDLYYSETEGYYFIATQGETVRKSSARTGFDKLRNTTSNLVFTRSCNQPLYLGTLKFYVDGKEVFSGNKTGLDVIKPDNYEVVGSPVISEDGVASGFSSSDYLLTSKIDIASSKSWEIISPKFKTTINSSRVQYVYYRDLTSSSQGGIYTAVSSSGAIELVCVKTNWQGEAYRSEINKIINPDNWYQTKIKFTGTQYEFYYKENDGEWVSYGIVAGSNLILNTTIPIGTTIDVSYQLDGQLDLNAFKIYVDGNLVYQPCLKIPYTQSKTGSKIVDGVYRDRVIDLYEQEGQAGYYTLDETNKNFTLPMGEIYGMIEGKADKKSLDSKVDTSSLVECAVIIDSYVNGSSGYNIYSNGYCEQWGNFGSAFSSWTAKTVTFLKEFKDVNYVVWAMSGHTSNTDSPSINAKTTSSFSCTPYNSTGNACWKACGYLAEGEY